MIGARAYRVLFALISLPLAVTTVVYFINHRYSGTPLWNLQGVPGMHTFVWALAFVSFLFLYPSTFNILEVAAVDKPKLHLWETGIMRITRHPQVSRRDWGLGVLGKGFKGLGWPGQGLVCDRDLPGTHAACQDSVSLWCCASHTLLVTG